MQGEGDQWFLLESGEAGAEENMAVDEALLDSSSQIGHPVLRFYRWSHSAASFGYSQNYGEVSGWTSVRPLVRRPTGGGMVLHGSDWTYSLIFPRDHWWHRFTAKDSYRRIHMWIQSALASDGVKTELSDRASSGLAGQCFARPEELDLLFEGKKIAGAAQRRSRTGLLIQGSVQSEMFKITESMWRRAMTSTFPVDWRADWVGLKLNLEVCRRVGELLRDKYLKSEYHQKR